MAVQHVTISERLKLPVSYESRGQQTVVFVATALPNSVVRYLPALAADTAKDLFGSEHLLDVAFLDTTAVTLTLGLKGSSAIRVADPALGQVLEAELSARLRSAGHVYTAVAVERTGDPMSERDRARDLWHSRLTAVQARAQRHAEAGSFRLELAQMIERREIRTMFQPIVDAKDRRILGYEALSRGPVGHRWERPDLLLEAAERSGLSSLVQWEMLRLARRRAAERLTSGEHLLFLNAPDTRFWPDARPEGDEDRAGSWPWNRVVSEVSERYPIANLPSVWETRDRGRARGIRFALDDVGAGYAGLAALALLAPDFVKVDMAIVRDCDRDDAKQAVVAALVQYAQRAEATVIAEGVETDRELRVLCDLGVGLVQGFLIAMPVEYPC
jgi:EAL domain-containing protein (putative c-di-GMP-specific phosphodiesterase class I)